MGAATFPLHRGDNTRAEALLVQPVRSRDEFLFPPSHGASLVSVADWGHARQNMSRRVHVDVRFEG